MPKAYLYNRVSSDQQVKFGEGLKRQEEAAIKFLSQYPEYEIADTIIDSGVSAYKGHNIDDGGLGKFIEMAKAGNIEPNSLLVIEAPDRLTRLGIKKGQRLFDEILECKINIALVRFGIVLKWDDENDFTGALIVSIGLYLGHLESKQKSERIRASKLKRQKQAVETGRVLTTLVPKWLKVTDDNGERRVEIDESRVAIINEIFDLYIEGYGFTKIANVLNKRHEPTWSDKGDLWHKSYIMNIIKNKAVLGEYQPTATEHQAVKGNKTARAQSLNFKSENYYPAAVSREKWELARAIWQSMSRGKGTNTGKGFKNLFTQGLAVCECCDKNMNFLSKGRGYSYLICPSNIGNIGRCTTRNIPYKKLERIILAAAETINYTDILTRNNETSRIQELKTQESDLRERISQTNSIIDNYKDFIKKGYISDEIASSILEAEAQRASLKNDLALVRNSIGEWNAAISGAGDIGSDFNALCLVMDKIEDIEELEALRGRIHRRLKDVFEKISVKFDEQWFITFHFKNSDIKLEIKTKNQNLSNYQWIDITNNRLMHPIARGKDIKSAIDIDYGSELETAFEDIRTEVNAF